MTHRLARVARLVAVAVLLGVIGGSSWSSSAAACSCGLVTTRQLVGQALAIVSGEPVDRWRESVDGWDYNVWAFEVDERWVGATPDVVEVQAAAEESSCGPPAEVTASILRLGWKASNGRFEVTSGCYGHTMDRAVVDRLFGPPELVADGQPVAVVSADAGGHAAKLVDADGRAVRYLPGDGETHGLAPCPGGEHFVQLRGGPGSEYGLLRSFELAAWRYDDWTEVGVHSVESPEAIETAETLVCLRPDGGDALIVWSSYLDVTRVVDGVDAAEMTTADQPVDIPGPDGAVFRFRRDQRPQVVEGAGTFDVTWVLGGGFTKSIHGDNLMSVSPVAEGWDLTVDDWHEVSAEESQSGFRVIHLGLDGQAAASSDFVPIRTFGWENGMLVPPERRNTAGLSAAVPLPMFERTGQALASPTEPSTASTATVIDPTIDGTTALAGSADPDRGGDVEESTLARWVAAGILMLVVVGGALLVVRRSGGRRVESSPRGGDS